MQVILATYGILFSLAVPREYYCHKAVIGYILGGFLLMVNLH